MIGNFLSAGREHAVYVDGFRAGQRWRKRHQDPHSNPAGALKTSLQSSWNRKAAKLAGSRASWPVLLRLGKRYAAGYSRGAGAAAGDFIPIPLQGTASAVVFARSDADPLPGVLRQLSRLPVSEIVVVLATPPASLHGRDSSEPRLKVHYRPGIANPNVGRALGASLTGADTVLFADGGIPARAEGLARFLWECDRGKDVALNDVSGKIDLFYKRNSVFRLAEFLNRTLGRRDLRAGSMSVLPYALSRKALDAAGSPGILEIPPKAYATLILRGLQVGTAGSVFPFASPTDSQDGRTISRQYAEAWKSALTDRGHRLLFPDTVRKRSVLGKKPYTGSPSSKGGWS